jgi:hypothetical protein
MPYQHRKNPSRIMFDAAKATRRIEDALREASERDSEQANNEEVTLSSPLPSSQKQERDK